MSKSREEKKYALNDIIFLSKGQQAIIKYIGSTHLGSGIYYGIEYIDGSIGKHNGTLKNKKYFNGLPNRCDFIRGTKIRRKLSKTDKKYKDIATKQIKTLKKLSMKRSYSASTKYKPMKKLELFENKSRNEKILNSKKKKLEFEKLRNKEIEEQKKKMKK